MSRPGWWDGGFESERESYIGWESQPETRGEVREWIEVLYTATATIRRSKVAQHTSASRADRSVKELVFITMIASKLLMRNWLNDDHRRAQRRSLGLRLTVKSKQSAQRITQKWDQPQSPNPGLQPVSSAPRSTEIISICTMEVDDIRLSQQGCSCSASSQQSAKRGHVSCYSRIMRIINEIA